MNYILNTEVLLLLSDINNQNDYQFAGGIWPSIIIL